MRRFSLLRSLLVLFVSVAIVGCATTASTPSPEERAAVVGVWEYRTFGSSDLGKGTIHFHVQNGRLRALLRDTQRGRLNAHVNQRGSRVELALDELRVSGRVEDNKFVGLFQRPLWDVTTSQDVRGSRQRSSSESGSMVALRVQHPGLDGEIDVLGCTPILEESDYRCGAPTSE